MLSLKILVLIITTNRHHHRRYHHHPSRLPHLLNLTAEAVLWNYRGLHQIRQLRMEKAGPVQRST